MFEKIDENLFWEWIEKLEWKDLCKKYPGTGEEDFEKRIEGIEENCRKRVLPFGYIALILDTIEDLYHQLYSTVKENLRPTKLSGDEWRHCITHIIGRGHDVYDWCMKHPDAIELIYTSADNKDLYYHEGFPYGILRYMEKFTKQAEVSREEVSCFRETIKCPDCGSEMVFDGMVLTSCPPQYPYTCPKCGYHCVKDELYPKITYEIKQEK